MSGFEYSFTFNYMSTDPKDLDVAAARGYDWILTGWLGHGSSEKFDLPVYIRDDARLTALRKTRYDFIAGRINTLRSFHEAAHERKLKVGLFNYDPSVPSEYKQAYPEVFYPYPDEYLAERPQDAEARLMCVYDPRVQAWVTAKVAEIIENLWPIDAYVFTCSETMWHSGPINHICANCYDRPRWEALKCLYEAVEAGIERSGRDVKLIQRTWALQHPDDFRRTAATIPRDWIPHDQDLRDLLRRTLQAGERPYVASRDYPRFIKYLETRKKPHVLSKATHADFLLQQPVNPWVGQSDKVEEIIELSLEPCFQHLYGYIPCVFVRQMQEHLQYGLSKGCKGAALLPIEARADWGLNLVNLDVGTRLIHEPHGDVRSMVSDWSETRYGRRFEPWLVEAMLTSENICADLASYNGLSNMMNFDCYRKANAWTLGLSQFYLWPMRGAFDDADARLDLGPAGLSRAIATWNKRVRQSKALHERITENIEAIPEAARADVTRFFERLETISMFTSLMQKQLFIRMALSQKTIEPNSTLMRLTERWDFQIYFLIASDAELREGSFTGKLTANRVKMAGWRYPDITEKDVFPAIGEMTEAVVDSVDAAWHETQPEIWD